MRTLFIPTLALSFALMPACTNGGANDTGADNGTDNGTDTGTHAGSSTVEGRVSDDVSSTARQTGGSGTLAAAVEVQAVVHEGGSTTVIGQADIESDGSYRMDCEPGWDRVVVHALDAQGEVVASAFLGSSGEADETVYVAPMTTETSAEGQVYLRLVVEAENEGWSESDTNYAEVLSRIDAEVAAAIDAYQQSTGDAELVIDAMAEAMIAAQIAQSSWWSSEGSSASHQAAADAMAQATADLNAALHAGDDAETAYDAWADAYTAAWTSIGLDSDAQAEQELIAGLTTRTVIAGLLDGESDASGFIEAWMVETGEREAAHVNTAVLAHVSAMVDDGDVVTECDEAGDTLEEDAAQAQTVADVQAAFDAYAAALVDGSLLSGSILESVIGVGIADSALYLATCEEAASSMESQLWTDLSAHLNAREDVDASLVSGAVLSGWSSFEGDVLATSQSQLGLSQSDELTAAASIMAMASGSYRGTFTDQW